MEAPLNAREFLKRFHLPQLVRLSTTSGDRNESHNHEEQDQCQDGQPISLRINTSSSLSTLVNNRAKYQQERKRQENYHEPSDWTYRRPNCEAQQVEEYDSWASEQELSHEVEQSGSRSLQVLECPDSMSDDSPSNGQRFCSISAWSSVQVDQMLQQRQQQKYQHQQAAFLDPESLPIRVPRASLVQQQQNIKGRRAVIRKSVEFTNEMIREVRGSGGIEQSIRLTPPSKRPTLSKLQLNQPFLLYKAYKKLELCAYVIDPKNELNDKSGDPIYFPQNYPGWFTLLDTNDQHFNNSRRKPLESIDQVCRTNAQIFLTRDELVGYQLPSKLSHLTKLKNNQLLALPLAIKLDKKKNKNKDRKRSSGAYGEDGSGKANGSKEQTSVSDIKQVVIECGQALKICGIYEDVLPLIEIKQQQQQQQFHELAKHRVERTILYEQSPFQQSHQQYFPYPTCQQQEQEEQHHKHVGHYKTTGGYQSVGFNGYHGGNQQRMLRAASQIVGVPSKCVKDGKSSAKLRATECALSGGHHEASQLVYAAQPLTGQQRVGQRYARCILLSQRSVDELTDCVSYRSASTTSGGTNPNSGEQEGKVQSTNDEIEVLIPIEQRGRFYLCATNQTILNEFGLMGNCNLCTSSQALQVIPNATNNSVVFKLSQIVYLLNLSRRLLLTRREGKTTTTPTSGSGEEGDRRRVFSSSSSGVSAGVRLPLSVELVLGPRPAHFSPSMFGGSSSSMESYFRCESNVAGHSLDCAYNRNFAGASSRSGARMGLGLGAAAKGAEPRQEQVVVAGVACPCALSLRQCSGLKGGKSYGLFSASLRIEQLTKRDVLLACTIKKDPLVHLDLFGGRTSEEDHSWSLLCCENGASSHTSATSSSNGSGGGGKFRCGQANGDSDWRQLRSHRLAALRESPNPRSKCEQEANSGSFKALGKSSFRRLRACRSLISLNGRRKKRPKIPSSMLSAAGSSSAYSSDEAPTGGAASGILTSDGMHSSSECNNESLASRMLGLRLGLGLGLGLGLEQDRGKKRNSETNNNNIVLLEIDCNERDLLFVRTFVESSIPTSRIPDLVLKRMDFCHRNSLDWERQLKLSYVSLSADFDSCKRQMELNLSRQKQQHRHGCRGRLLAVSERNLSERREAQLSMSSMSLAKGDSGGVRSSVAATRQEVNSGRSLLFESSSCSGTSANSTASSSRSSSGVSSSNERVVVVVNGNGNGIVSKNKNKNKRSPTTLSGSRVSFMEGGENSLTSHSSSIGQAQNVALNNLNLQCESECESECELGFELKKSKKSVQATSSSRLLRLVHKILPSSGRPSNEDEKSTVMVVRRERRMRLTGSDQVDISLEFADDAQADKELSSSSLRDADGDGDGDEDDGSHLYESLERLSEKLKRVGLTNRSVLRSGNESRKSNRLQ